MYILFVILVSQEPSLTIIACQTRHDPKCTVKPLENTEGGHVLSADVLLHDVAKTKSNIERVPSSSLRCEFSY